MHLSGLDVIGSTAGSLSRVIQDRELELWEGKRVVGEASIEEINQGQLSVAHPSFRVIMTASKSLPLKEWVADEHANMFFTIPSQPMDQHEEASILRATGCPEDVISTLLNFAEKYRSSLSSDNIIKNRRLGTRTLVSIAKRIVASPQDNDLNMLLSRALLAEFLPAAEKMNLNTLLEDSNIFKQTQPVSSDISDLRLSHTDISLSSTQTRLCRMAPSSSRHPPSATRICLPLRSPSLMQPKIQRVWHLMSPTWTITTTTAYRRG